MNISENQPFIAKNLPFFSMDPFPKKKNKKTSPSPRTTPPKKIPWFLGFPLLSCWQGAQGERLRGTSVWAAHALRASGSYLLSLAGDKPPEAHIAGWLWVGWARPACLCMGMCVYLFGFLQGFV